MPTDAFDFEMLSARFGKLGRRDRKAILANLAPSDRARVEMALAVENEAKRREADQRRRAGKQFAIYSSWLSPIVEMASADDADASGAIRPAAREAITELHRAMKEQQQKDPPSFPNRIRRWASGLFSSEARGGV